MIYFTRAVVIVIPAEGPSLGIAAAGKCIFKSILSKKFDLISLFTPIFL